MSSIFSSQEFQKLLSEVLSVHSRLPRVSQATREKIYEILELVEQEQALLVQEWIDKNTLIVTSFSESDLEILLCLKENRGIFIIGDPQRRYKVHFSPFI